MCAAVCDADQRAVARRVAADDDLVAGFELLPRPAHTHELRTRAALGEPLLDRAVIVDVEVDPHVRVAELIFGDGAFDRDLFGQVVEHRG